MSEAHRLVLAALATAALGACSGSSVEDTPDASADTNPQETKDVAAPDADGSITPSDLGPDVSDSGDARDEPHLREVPRPPPPMRDETVRTVSVTVRTGGGTTAGTDDGVQICLTESNCFALDTPDVDDRERGNVEVYHIDTNLPRDAVDQMTLESTSTSDNNDRWTPTCVDVRLDGEPVYCNDQLGIQIGTGPSDDEFASWTDPDGLRETCTSCWGDTLTHGPLVGPPTEESIRVAVRTDATRATALRLGTEPDLSDGVVVDWSYPEPTDDFTTDLQVDRLRADTEYFYRVEVDAAQETQPIRAIRTAPAPGTPVETTIAFGSCTRDDEQPIFDVIAETNPDLFFFVGDNNYANSPERDALRWHYRRFQNVTPRARLVAETPTGATWDDHDFVENNSNGTCLGRDEALAAFREYWANPGYGLAETPGTFFRSSWGAIDFFTLDCRTYRPDVDDVLNRCEPDPDPPQLDIEDGPLGPAQEAWLIDELSRSEATFKLLICGSRFTPDGSNDSWASFPEARERLFGAIDERGVSGVVLLSGDVHRSVFSSLPAPAYPIPELVSSPLSTRTSSCNDVPTQRTCYDEGNSFVQLNIDPTLADPTLTARILDESGVEQASWTILHSELTGTD